MIEDRFTRAIERELESLAKSTMEKPPQSYEGFLKLVGEYKGLSKALALFQSKSEEVEKELNRG